MPESRGDEYPSNELGLERADEHSRSQIGSVTLPLSTRRRSDVLMSRCGRALTRSDSPD